MGVKEENLSIKEGVLETIKVEANTIDNKELSMKDLISRISLLSKNTNPYSVSKEIDEIKSIFYIKLKLEKEELNAKQIAETEDNINQALHPLEVKFKSVFDTYRKIKADARKNKAKVEKQNLKIKQQLIKDIDSLVKEGE